MTISDSVATVGEYAFLKAEMNIIQVVGDKVTDYSSLLGMLPEFSTFAVYSDAAVDISKIRDGDENTHII